MPFRKSRPKSFAYKNKKQSLTYLSINVMAALISDSYASFSLILYYSSSIN